VTECASLPLSTVHDGANYHYYIMEKCGYTTFDAVELLAQSMGLEKDDIGYAGLKDEDGITEQIISLTKKLPPENVTKFNQYYNQGKEKYIFLVYKGCGHAPMQIGRLHGNAFRITIRRLPGAMVQAMERFSKIQCFFLNYYDTQRFGIPGFPQVAHQIGEKLLEKDYHGALEYFAVSGNAEAADLYGHVENPQAFFQALDIRKQTFFMNAFSSFQWNRRLGELLRKICGEETIVASDGDILFHFAPEQGKVIQLLARCADLPYVKYVNRMGKVGEKLSYRPTVVQAFFEEVKVEEDELHQGFHKCTFSFFLPSGCYATMAVKQWMLFMQNQMNGKGGV